jgi:SAM-dependent methyltransferase
MYEYDDEFYRYINTGALRSAEILIPEIRACIPHAIESVLDVGCGAGAWLSVWKKQGCAVLGLDGSYLDSSRLLVDRDEFLPRDLGEEFSLARQFDLVQCLEVAEHLPPERSRTLVADLCRHGALVFFSAAPPGQGGENDVNEQPYGFWRALFAEQGYTMYDPWRARIVDNKAVMPWYRYNSFLFARADALPRCHSALAGCRVEEGREPPDIAPALYRLRKRLVRLLPLKMATGLAVIKKTLYRRAGRV